MSRAPENSLPTHLCRFAVRTPSTVRHSFLKASSTPSVPSLSPWRRPAVFRGGFACRGDPTPHGHFQSSARFMRFVMPITKVLGGTGIFNLFSIAYAVLPRLRVRLTQGRRTLPWKPRVFGEGDSHPLCRVLMPCILTSLRSSTPCGIPSAHRLRSPTPWHFKSAKAAISVGRFSPGYFRRRASRWVSCYALFK